MEPPTVALQKKRRDSKLKERSNSLNIVSTNISDDNMKHTDSDENSSWLVSLREQGKKAFRCYVIGDASVGKTSLCFRMSKGILVDVPSTDDELHIIECDISKQQKSTSGNNRNSVHVNKGKLVPVTLEIIDVLSSSADIISKTKREYPTAYICTYSVTSTKSYEYAKELIENLKLHAHAFHPIIMTSCKSDLQNNLDQMEVKEKYARRFAAKHKIHFVTTSALNSLGIDELMSRVGELLLKYRKTYNKLNKISNKGSITHDSSDDESGKNGDLLLCAAGNCGSGRDRARYNNEKSISQIDKYERESVTSCTVM
eukprot:g7567.t1